MTWVATGIIGGTIVGGIISSDASKSAANTQAQGLNNATQSQQGMFNQQNQQQAPYRQSGYQALNQISTGFGQNTVNNGSGPLTEDQVQQIYKTYMGRPVLPDEMQSLMATNTSAAQLEKSVSNSSEAAFHQNVQRNVSPVTQPLFSSDPNAGTSSNGGIDQGQFTHQFNANDLQTNLSPSYGFMLGQGLTSTANLSNLSGGAFSGNTLKAINDYAQNYASTGYQQAYENYNTNQTNIYNRLASIAGLGQTAGSNSSTGASSFSSGIAGSTAASAAAQAGGTIGSANALTGAGNSAMGWYAGSKYLNQNQTNSNTGTVDPNQYAG